MHTKHRNPRHGGFAHPPRQRPLLRSQRIRIGNVKTPSVLGIQGRAGRVINAFRLAQQLQGRLRQDVRLRQDRRARADQNLVAREHDGLDGDVRVADGAFRSRRVFLLDRQRTDGELEAILERTKIASERTDARQRNVHRADGGHRPGDARNRQRVDA